MWLIAVLTAGLFCSGCQHSGITGSSNEVVSMATTSRMQEDIQYLEEQYGFTSEELAGLDVSKFVEDYEIRTRDYEPAQVRKILELQRDIYEEDSTEAVFYLLREEGRTLQDGDVPVLIGVSLNLGTGMTRYLYDLENAVWYWNSAEAHPMSSEAAESLRTLPERRNMSSWKAYTRGERNSGTGSIGWKMVFQMENGDNVVYEGFAQDESGLPEGFQDVLMDLEAASSSADGT